LNTRIFKTTLKASLTGAIVAVWSALAPIQAPAQTAIAPKPAIAIDYRETMRQLVQNISRYGRSLKPNFIVIAENGLGLVSKPDPQDDTQLFPAQTYIRSIDGVLQPHLLKMLSGGDPKEDPDITTARNQLTTNTDMAKSLGINIFNLEFATKAAEIDKIYQKSAAKGFKPFVANTPMLTRIPGYPKYAYHANPKSLSDTRQATNYLYIENSQGFGTANDYVQALSGTNYDIIITSVFHGRVPLTKFDVERLKYKKLGSRRLVLAEIDLSSAATYHYYWQAGWAKGSPAFISDPIRTDPDRHRTLYWEPAWQSILAGGPSSYLYGIADLGFDGVVLKGVEAWHHFETGDDQ